MGKTTEDGKDEEKRSGLFSGLRSRGEDPLKKESLFEITIEELPKKFSQVVISRMQILNLSTLIVRRDIDINEVIKAAEVIAVGVIEDNLREKDAYIHNDIGVYGFLFPGVSKNVAELKCQVIADQIGRLINDPSNLSPDLAFEAKTRRRRSGTFADLVARQKTNKAASENKTPDADKLRELELKKAQANMAIQQMADRLSRDGQDSKAEPVVWLIEDDESKADNKYLPEGITTVFRAMWNVSNKLLTAHSALPVIKSPEGQIESIISIKGESTKYADAACDRLVQEEALKKLHILMDAGHKVLLVLPVHFSTVAHHDYFVSYQQRLRALDEKRRRLVVLELVGVPPDLNGDRIGETVTRLRQVARSVMARLSPSVTRLRPWREAGVHAVGFDVEESQASERVLLKQLDGFAGHAEEAGLKKFVYGLTTRSAASAAVTAGFDYIEGIVVRRPMDSPTYVEPFESLDLFTGLCRR